jgi:hypothetical protein
LTATLGYLRYYLGSYPVELKQPTTNLNGGSRPLDWDMKGTPSEYQAGVLPALLDGRNTMGSKMRN